MFDHKHYVPVLKTKAGERWSVDHMGSALGQITPVLEVHSNNKKEDADHVEEVLENLASVWREDREFFLDTIWLHGDQGDPQIIAHTFNYARGLSLPVVPVVRPSYSQATIDVVKDIMEEDKLGAMIRLTREQFTNSTVVNDLVKLLGVDPSKIHFLMDYQRQSMALSVDLQTIPHVSAWKTFSAVSGVFPRSISYIPVGVWQDVPRSCWNSWLADAVTGKLPRIPTFGDFTVRDPGPPASGGEPSVNVRYTSADAWTCRMGGKHKLGQGPDIYQIAGDLVKRPYYSGNGFSEGDRIYSELAQQQATPGGPQQWVQWAINHHLEYVVEQIQSHPSL